MKILIITDIHANYQALIAVLNQFGDADEIWCIGDIVEIGPRPAACIDLIQASCRHVVQGNHDASFVAFDPEDAPPGWNGWEYHQATPDHLTYLNDLPTNVTAEADGRAYLLVHGSPENPLTGRMDPDTDPAVLRAAAQHTRSGIICGHTHMAMITEIDGKSIVNAGTVGQPRDGDYRAQCMILEDGVFTYHLVDYDLDAMESDYRASSMPVHVQEEWIRHTRSGIVDRHGLQRGPLSRPADYS